MSELVNGCLLLESGSRLRRHRQLAHHCHLLLQQGVSLHEHARFELDPDQLTELLSIQRNVMLLPVVELCIVAD